MSNATYEPHCKHCGELIAILEEGVNYFPLHEELPTECESCRKKPTPPKNPKGKIYFNGALMDCPNCEYEKNDGYLCREQTCKKCNGKSKSCDECEGYGTASYCDWPCWMCNRVEYDAAGGDQIKY
eukprot:313015_1